MGVLKLRRGMSSSVGDRRGSFVAVTPLVVMGFAAFIVVLNLRHFSSICDSESAKDEAVSREAIDRRIRMLENEIFQNSIFVSRLLKGLDKAFKATELLSVDELRDIAKREAIEVGQRRAAKPPPPFYAYARDSLGASIEDGSLQDLIHTSLMDETYIGDEQANVGGGDQGWDWNPQSTSQDDWLRGEDIQAPPLVDIPDEAARLRQCIEWSQRYNVVKGIDWGRLPVELQKQWTAFSCDRASAYLKASDRPKQISGEHETVYGPDVSGAIPTVHAMQEES